MQRIPALGLVLAATSLVIAPAFAQRLVSQTTKGVKRECVYQMQAGQRLRPQYPLRSVTVGLGEPCPPRLRETSPEPERIPVLATLSSRRLVGNDMVCTYRYNGRYYSRAISATARCPLTPDF
jgi:hypothetical protein